MANPFANIMRSNFGAPTDEATIQQRQQMANMLMQFGAQPGGGLPAGIAALIGGIQQGQAQRGANDLLKRREADRVTLNSTIATALEGGDWKTAAAAMARSSDPETANTGLQFLMENATKKPMEVADDMLGKYTPESIQQFVASRDYSKLVPVGETISAVDQSKIDLNRARAAAAGRPAQAAPTAIDSKIAALIARGATDDEIKTMLLGERSVPPETALEKARAGQQAKREAAAPAMLASVESAESALAAMEAATKKGVGGPFEAMFGTAINPALSAYETDASVLSEELTRLRRVPGIGSQSNLELQHAVKAIQDGSSDPSIREANFKRIRNILSQMKATFQNPAMGGQPSAAPSAPVTGGLTGDPLIDKYLTP